MKGYWTSDLKDILILPIKYLRHMSDEPEIDATVKYFNDLLKDKNNDEVLSHLWVDFVAFISMICFKHIACAGRTPDQAEEFLNGVIKTWTTKVRKQLNSSVKGHTNMMETDIGKMLKEVVGDGEKVRVDVNKRINHIEQMARQFLGLGGS